MGILAAGWKLQETLPNQ